MGLVDKDLAIIPVSGQAKSYKFRGGAKILEFKLCSKMSFAQGNLIRCTNKKKIINMSKHKFILPRDHLKGLIASYADHAITREFVM